MIKNQAFAEPNTLWIDLTDIVDWQGNYTGIQRVEMQLSERFYNYFPAGKVRFFKHNIANYSFDEVDFEAFLKDQAVRRKIMVGSKKDDYTPALRELPPGQLLKKAAKSLLPIAGVKALSVSKGKVSKRRNDLVFKKTTQKVEAPFKAGEKVLVLGGNWGSRYFMPALLLAKQRYDFKFYHVLYDLIPLVQPAYTPVGVGDKFADYMNDVIRHTNGLFAISESTKRDAEIFVEQQKLNHEVPIDTFRLGDDFAVSEAAKPKKLGDLKGDFILCVGTFEVRKNYNLLYYVVKEARRQGVTIPPIVIAGKRGWLVDDTIHLMNHDVEIQDKIIHLSKTTDNELSWLYQNCKFTVFPSFYEGWGLPIAESLFYKKFCLASGTSSMPEIAGDLVTYFSPTNMGDCLDKIVHYTTHPDELSEREQRIAEKYKPTTWEQSFQTFLSALYSR